MDKAKILEKFPITQNSTVYHIVARPSRLYEIETNAGLVAAAGGAAGVAVAAGATAATAGATAAATAATAGAVAAATAGAGAVAGAVAAAATAGEITNFIKGCRNFGLMQIPNITYALNNPDETAYIVGAVTGLIGVGIEPIQLYKQEFDKRFDLFQEYIEDAVIPNTHPLLYNTIEQKLPNKSPTKIFQDLTTIVNTAFPKKSAWGFSRHSTSDIQKTYKGKREEVMDLSRQFRDEYKIAI